MSFIGTHAAGYLLRLILQKVSAVIVVLMAVHAAALSTTLYRFQYRYSHSVEFWRDDAFALLTTIGDLYMLGLLASTGESCHFLPRHA